MKRNLRQAEIPTNDDPKSKRRRIQKKDPPPPTRDPDPPIRRHAWCLDNPEQDQINHVKYQYKNKKFDLEGVLGFLRESKIDEKYIHFDEFDVKYRGKDKPCYFSSKGVKPGFFSSMLNLKGELMLNGFNYRETIPNRMYSYDDVAVSGCILIGRDKRLEMNDFVVYDNNIPKFYEERRESNRRFVKKYNRENSEFKISKAWEMITKYLKVNREKYIHFTPRKAMEPGARLYFDNGGTKLGFFCDINDVKESQRERGIPVDKRIPTMRVTKYIDLVDCVDFIKVLEKLTENKIDENYINESDGGDESGDDDESDDDEEFAKVKNIEVIVVHNSSSEEEEEGGDKQEEEENKKEEKRFDHLGNRVYGSSYKCEMCGNEEKDDFGCVNCGIQLCRDCLFVCDICDHELCTKCSTVCKKEGNGGCDNVMCQEGGVRFGCQGRCSSCEDYFCIKCLKDGKCLTCV